MSGTELLQLTCGTCIDALEQFGLPDRGNRDRIPIVLMPRRAKFPYTQVPDGIFALKYRSGRLVGELNSGFHFLGPLEEVKYCLTKQDTMMDIPIQDSPTKDNAMVRIDIFLMFRIVDPKKFINELSPHKLTDLLRSAQEEAVRHLARSLYIADIYDLVKFDEEEIREDISKKFERYGVIITQLMITEVKCRDEIKDRLQRETVMKSETELQMRKQEYDMLVVNEIDEIEKLKLDNEIKRQVARDSYQKKFLEVEKEIAELRQRTQKRMAEIKSSEMAIVSKIKAESEKYASKIVETMKGQLLKIDSDAKSQVTLLQAEKESYRTEVMSETDLIVNGNKAEILKVVGEAEAIASKKLRAKRKFETELAKIEVLESLGNNAGNVLISGNTNGNIVSEIISSNIQKDLYLK